MERFGDVLKVVREGVGVSQARLAESANLDHSTISRYEGHSRFPTREMVDALGDALRLPPEGRARLYVSAGYLPVAPSLRKACAKLVLQGG